MARKGFQFPLHLKPRIPRETPVFRVQGLEFQGRPGGYPGANGWFLESTPIQMPPHRGGICGMLTYDLLPIRLQGGQEMWQSGADIGGRAILLSTGEPRL